MSEWVDFCCEDCAHFEEISPWVISDYGVCKLDGYTVETLSDICDEFEEREDD